MTIQKKTLNIDRKRMTQTLAMNSIRIECLTASVTTATEGVAITVSAEVHHTQGGRPGINASQSILSSFVVCILGGLTKQETGQNQKKVFKKKNMTGLCFYRHGKPLP